MTCHNCRRASPEAPPPPPWDSRARPSNCSVPYTPPKPFSHQPYPRDSYVTIWTARKFPCEKIKKDLRVLWGIVVAYVSRQLRAQLAGDKASICRM